MGDFEGRNPGESLESFIDRVVNPDSKYIAQTKTTIHKVAELMKSKSVDHKIATTVKGGSLGKGTAVKGRSDADLLFVYGDIKSIETLKAELQKLLRELQSALDRSEYKVTAIKKTPFTIQFELQIDGTWNEVDVLPIIELPFDPSNPSKEALGPIYQQMKANEDLREYYFKCLAPLQVRFVSRRDEKLKRSIRLLKFWIKTRKHVLKSYAAELLVIKAYEEIGSPAAGKLKTLELMTKVFQKLSDIRTLTVSWDTYYSPASYYLPSPPYILDPAFPYHNLTRQKSGGLDEKYVHLERDAKKFLANLNGSTQDRCSVTESLAKLSIGPSSLSSSSGDRVSDSLKVVANGSLTVFEGRQPKESLESFIDRVVNPDPKYTTQMKAAIHSVAELMKSKSVDHKIGTILKGGSLGKGTAVKGRSDADLSLAYVDIKSVLDLSVKLPDLLRELQSALENSEYKITSVKRTKFTIQFEIIVDGIVNEVDLLPIVSLPVDLNNPSKAALDPIYKQMKENEGIRDYYCKCLAPLQVNFVSKRTDKVKRSIRLLKYWIKTQKHVLKSYAAELLVIKAYEELGSPEPGKMKTADLMTKVFDKLSNLKSLAVSWDTYYSPSAYKLPSPPYILDPAFPYHNLIEQKSARLDEQYVALERDAKKVLPSMKL